jgi:homoserine O-acetyltransferase
MPMSCRLLGVVAFATACLAPHTDAAAAGALVDIEKRIFLIRDFRLQSGVIMPEVTIAYETYGTMAPDGRNAVLLTHGYTGSQHGAGAYPGEAPSGSWNDLIGPGKSIDSDKLFIVSSNMLGSSYGSTSPAFTNPATGKPYGPDFPEISVVDIVTAQHRLLEHLGVRHLLAVVGASYGGYQAFQWAVTCPDFVDGIVPVVSAPKGSGDPSTVDKLIARLAVDPNWNGGRYYDRGGVVSTLTEMRIDTLKNYGVEAQLMETFPDPAARAAELRRLAEKWAHEFDANSLVVLRRASVAFDATKDFAKLKARVLYVLLTTDKLFPPSIAPGVMAKLKAAGVAAEYVEVDSAFGHSGYGREAAKWGPRLRDFMGQLTQAM